MQLIKLNISILVLILALVNTASANNSNSVDSESSYKSSIDNDDIITKLSKKKSGYKVELGDKGYQIASGMSNTPDNFNDEVAVDALYIAFKEAYALAVVNLILEETGANITSELSSNSASNLGTKHSNAQKCIDDYNQKQKFLKDEDDRWKKSPEATVERIADKILAKTYPSEDIDISDNNKKPIDTLIECSTPFREKSLSVAISKSIQNGVFGVRIMETLLDADNSAIGVIVGRSPESSKDAGVLRVQNITSKPLPNALKEITAKSMSKIKQYEQENREPPFGIFGVQGIRLSNGEMAYIGFGTSLKKQVLSELDSNANSLAVELANTKALTALVEFSYMTASSVFQSEMKKVTERVITETLDMEKQGNKVSFSNKLQETVRSVMQRDVATNAEGFLKSPQQIDVSAWKGGDKYPDFYLSIWAWSPSLMTNAINRHDSYERAYQDGQSSNINIKVSPDEEIKSFKIEQDW